MMLTQNGFFGKENILAGASIFLLQARKRRMFCEKRENREWRMMIHTLKNSTCSTWSTVSMCLPRPCLFSVQTGPFSMKQG